MGVITCHILAVPESVQNAVAFGMVIERRDDGVPDLSFNGTATISKVSGTGSLGGTLTTATFVEGRATILTPAITGSGDWVLRATLSSGQTADSGTIKVAETAYSVTNGYCAIDQIYDVSSDITFNWQLRVPSGASAGVALPLTFYLHPAGRYQSNYADNAANTIAAHRADAFGVRVDAGAVTGFVVFLPCRYTTDACVAAYHRIFPKIVDRLIARGYNINRRRINSAGFSTGDVTYWSSVFANPDFWNAHAGADGGLVSGAVTDNKRATPLAYLGPAFYDGPPSDLVGSQTFVGDGDPSNDVLMHAEWARLLDVHGMAFIHAVSNDTSTAPFWGRAINDWQPTIDALNARSAGIATSSSAASSTALATITHRFTQRKVTDTDHGATASWLFNSTNYPTVQAFYDANERPLPATPTLPTPARPASNRALI